MKHQGRWALGLGILTLALVASPAAAQTAANGPYYANPSWDQQLPAAQRFIVLSNWNNAAVLDRETGLVWQRSPGAAPQDFENASQTCLSSTMGNRLGWRLPTINELASLFDPSASGPFLPAGHPFTDVPPVSTGGTAYWSATPRVDIPTDYRCISYGLPNGGVPTLFTACQVNVVNPATPWCVRGGLLAGPQ